MISIRFITSGGRGARKQGRDDREGSSKGKAVGEGGRKGRKEQGKRRAQGGGAAGGCNGHRRRSIKIVFDASIE